MAGRCSLPLLTVGPTPQCLSAQSQLHALGAKGSFSSPLGLGLGQAPVTGAHNATPTFLPSLSRLEPPCTCSLQAYASTHPVTQGQNHFKIGAKVTKCLSSKGRHAGRKHIGPRAQGVVLYLSLTLGGRPCDYPGEWSRQTRHRGLNSLSRTNSSKQAQPTAKLAPSSPVLAATELGVV